MPFLLSPIKIFPTVLCFLPGPHTPHTPHTPCRRRRRRRQIAADVAHSMLLVATQQNRTDALPKWLLAHGDTDGMDGLHSGAVLCSDTWHTEMQKVQSLELRQ